MKKITISVNEDLWLRLLKIQSIDSSLTPEKMIELLLQDTYFNDSLDKSIDLAIKMRDILEVNNGNNKG